MNWRYGILGTCVGIGLAQFALGMACHSGDLVDRFGEKFHFAIAFCAFMGAHRALLAIRTTDAKS